MTEHLSSLRTRYLYSFTSCLFSCLFTAPSFSPVLPAFCLPVFLLDCIYNDMEVTKRSFNWHLPRMLKDLSECCCVALDMEFSGIAVRPSDGSPASHGSRSTIQERYLEVKAAAETYQILQVGLTFVEEDAENGQRNLKGPWLLNSCADLDQCRQLYIAAV